jgi:Na+/citrate or Na+/malate symporter
MGICLDLDHGYLHLAPPIAEGPAVQSHGGGEVGLSLVLHLVLGGRQALYINYTLYIIAIAIAIVIINCLSYIINSSGEGNFRLQGNGKGKEKEKGRLVSTHKQTPGSRK